MIGTDEVLSVGDVLISVLLVTIGWMTRRIVNRLDCHDKRLSAIEGDTRVLLDRSKRAGTAGSDE